MLSSNLYFIKKYNDSKLKNNKRKSTFNLIFDNQLFQKPNTTTVLFGSTLIYLIKYIKR